MYSLELQTRKPYNAQVLLSFWKWRAANLNKYLTNIFFCRTKFSAQKKIEQIPEDEDSKEN
jgi:hypothetical protein